MNKKMIIVLIVVVIGFFIYRTVKNKNIKTLTLPSGRVKKYKIIKKKLASGKVVTLKRSIK